MPPARLRVGVVGVGHLGQHHARIYDRMDEAELVGVSDRRVARAEEIAARPSVPVFADPRDLIGKTEDVANARLRFESGGVALLTASRASVKKMRKIRMFQRDAYISLDYDAKKAVVFKKRPGFEFGEADLAGIDTSLPPAELQA